MPNRRSFLKGMLGILAGFGCIASPLHKHDFFPAPPGFDAGRPEFDHGWFQLKNEGDGYVVPGVLAVVAGGSLIITKSFQPGRLAVYSGATWSRLVEKIQRYSGPGAERSAMIRLIVAPAIDVDLQDNYLEIPGFLKVHAGLKNANLILAFDGEKGFLQAAG